MNEYSLNEGSATPDCDGVTLSVVISTHNRIELFKDALQSLKEQDADTSRFEIIVVDNDTQPTKEIQAMAETDEPGVRIRYIHEPNLGLSNARNAGGMASSADYFSLFDDDAIAPTNYVSRMLAVLDEERPDVCGGPVLPLHVRKKPIWFKETYCRAAYHGDSRKELKANQFLSGPNIAFRKGLLDKSGWFDPSLSMKGKRTWYGSETLVQLQAWSKFPSLKVIYDPGIFVDHIVMPIRHSALKRIYSSWKIGLSNPYFWITSEQVKRAQLKAPLKLARVLAHFAIRSLPGVLWRNREEFPYWQNYAYERISREAQGLGEQWRLTKDLLLRKQNVGSGIQT